MWTSMIEMEIMPVFFSYSLNVQRARQRANADDGLTRELVMKRTDEDNWDTIERMQENTHITSVLESLGL